ncbi:S2539 protein, partial [Spelaeornis formosus]|nr:S2539 protein [Elachura formosa]
MAEKMPPSPGGGITPLQQMLASGTGAILTSLFVTPLDVVKIRLQAQRTPFSKGTPGAPQRAELWKCFLYCNGLMDHLYVCQNGNGCSAWYKAPSHFTGTLVGAPGMGRPQRAAGVFSGGLFVLLPPLTPAPGALLSPQDAFMQSQQLSYRELHACIRSAVAQDGWLSLWRGWGPTVLRDVPFSALYWFNYELVRTWLCRQAWLDGATFMVSFTSGAISGTVAAVLTLPFDVVKTQRQIELGDSEVHPATASKPSSTWLLMQRIRAESGTRGLFAGFLPRVIKVAPACAIMISTYEFGKSFFQKLNQEQQLRGL